MSLRHPLSIAVLGALALAALPGMASANSYGSGAPNSDHAQASDKISIFQGPHYRANEIVGMLQPGEVVTIDRCNAQGTWCRVFSNEPTGWVPASYLIGSKAKADATPLQSLTSPSVSSQNDLRPFPRGSDGGFF